VVTPSERWAAACPARADHPILAALGLGPEGLRQEGDLLLVLAKDLETRKVVGLQEIGPDGTVHGQGRVAGAMASIGASASREVIYVCAPWAVGAQIHAETKAPVAVAFEAANVPTVAEAMRRRYPDARIVLADEADGSDRVPLSDETAQLTPARSDPSREADAVTWEEAETHEAVEGAGARARSRSDGSHRDKGTTRAVLRRLADVEPVRVEWLWPEHVPLGRLTMLDGDPGLGKSTLTLDLVARVTTGRAMPDGKLGLDGARGVVLLGAEDGLADTVRPRLDAVGADPTRVVALAGVRERDGGDGEVRVRLPTVLDVGAIQDAAEEVDAALLVVDPLSAYLAGADSHRDADVRQALADLAALAERSGLAVLAVRHLNKGGGGNPLYRGGGSIAFIAAARSGMLLARDPEDEDRLVLARTKGNLAAPWPSLALRIVTEEDVARVEWIGGSERSAADLLAEPADSDARTERDEAVEWLRAALKEGERPVREMEREARAHGIAPRTLRRARKQLQVVSKRVGYGADGEWKWHLPEGAAIDGHPPWPSMGRAEVAPYEESIVAQGVSGDSHSIGGQLVSVAAYEAVERAVALLRRELADGPRTTSVLRAAAEGEGLARHTLDEAARRLNIEPWNDLDGETWELPATRPTGDDMENPAEVIL